MMLLTGRADSYAQFITVLLLFVVVLSVTALVTKWIAGYQKQQNVNCNIEVMETTRIANNKYVQLIRIGETYMAIAICKDTVTMLGEIPGEQLKEGSIAKGGMNFRELLDHVMKKDIQEVSSAEDASKDNSHEE